MDTIVLHQSGIAGRDTLEKARQVVDTGFCGHLLENFLETGIIGRTEIGWHAYTDEQYGRCLLLCELYHLPEVVSALSKAEPAQAVVAAEFNDQVTGLVFAQ